jgi:hypothetical protein
MINRTGTRAPERAAAYWAARGHVLPSDVVVRVAPISRPRAGEACPNCFGGWDVTIAPGWECNWLVVAHEFGHVLGFGHDVPGQPIMADTVSAIRP